MKTKHIIIGLVVILIVLFLVQQKEHAGSTPPTTIPNLSNEAIQNISKVYADTSNTATFNNINTTGTIRGNITGNVTGNVAGNVTGDNGNLKNITSTDTATFNNVNINGTLTGKTKANTLIVDKLCFTTGACITPNDIGIIVYKKDSNGVKRGVTIGSNERGNDAHINHIGYNNGNHKWMNLSWPFSDPLILNTNPYD